MTSQSMLKTIIETLKGLMPAWLLACFTSNEVKEIPPEERLDMYDTEGVTKIEPVAKKVDNKASIMNGKSSNGSSNGAKPKDKARKVLVRMDTQDVLKVDSLVDVWFPKEEFYSGEDTLDDLLVREKIQEAKDFVQKKKALKQEIRAAADKLLHKTEEGFHDDQYLTYEINHSMGKLQAKVKEVESEMDQALNGWQRKVDRAEEMLKTSEISINIEPDDIKDADDQDKKEEESKP